MPPSVDEYVRYHWDSVDMGDVDPSYSLLRYLCDRFDLNTEQRYWLAYLYGMTYCGPSVYYVYSEFPDLENVDLGRMSRWWDSVGREATYFQTDRRWVRSRNQFVPSVGSYIELLAGGTQERFFRSVGGSTPQDRYDRLFLACGTVQQMGRFALWNWLEAVHVVTGLDIEPRTLPLEHAESCANGVAYALDRPDLLSGSRHPSRMPSGKRTALLQRGFDDIVEELRRTAEGRRADPWNAETTLCAYRKHKEGKRYVGYYLERQAEEIATMSKARGTSGVDWGVLRDYRRETFGR